MKSEGFALLISFCKFNCTKGIFLLPPAVTKPTVITVMEESKEFAGSPFKAVTYGLPHSYRLAFFRSPHKFLPTHLIFSSEATQNP